MDVTSESKTKRNAFPYLGKHASQYCFKPFYAFLNDFGIFDLFIFFPVTRFLVTSLFVTRYFVTLFSNTLAVHLFSNRSQMTSKCGKNKKVAHEAIVYTLKVNMPLSIRVNLLWQNKNFPIDSHPEECSYLSLDVLSIKKKQCI